MKKRISRKEFIKNSATGMLGAGIAINSKVGLLRKDKIQNTTLGKTGLVITELGFGAPRTQQPALIKYAIDQGILFIDTGRSYGQGRNEEMVGKVIKDLRKQLVIQSKIRINLKDFEDGTSSGSLHERIKEYFRKSLIESLAALQTDYIDIMLIHGAETIEEIYNEAVMEAFSEARDKGVIRAAGFSAHTNQVELVKAVNERGFYNMFMIAFNPFGKFTHSRSESRGSWNQEELIRELKIAAGKGTGIIAMKTCSGGAYSPSNAEDASLPAAVKWVLDQDYVHSAVVAMANFGEVDAHTGMLRRGG